MSEDVIDDIDESKPIRRVSKRASKRRPMQFSDLVVVSREITMRTAALHELVTLGCTDPKRTQVALMMIWWSWFHQRQLPDSIDDWPNDKLRGAFGIDVRSTRRVYADCLETVQRIARGRAPFSSVAHEEIFELSGGLCHHCRQPIEFETFHIDHLVPIVYGGLGGNDNLVASCPPCNMQKGARLS